MGNLVDGDSIETLNPAAETGYDPEMPAWLSARRSTCRGQEGLAPGHRADPRPTPSTGAVGFVYSSPLAQPSLRLLRMTAHACLVAHSGQHLRTELGVTGGFGQPQ